MVPHSYRRLYFNPRTPYGGATYIYHILTDGSIISIHAPVWVRRCLHSDYLNNKIFQSTHPCWVRQLRSNRSLFYRQFQSTHPCGMRRGVIARFVASLVLMQFQISHWLSNLITGPRLQHERSKSLHQCIPLSSIYATIYFNSRTYVGATYLAHFDTSSEHNFNPRTHVGCDIS